ncbi:apolipoprotein N-acyltransferase [Thalassococcus profundi]|uniref:apolipoprotein N-acyltransferase n=1 Tax=Thalassococcus profundi TaxID=2282382 RepID=UPI001F26E0FF|nr:apolipoprotein N-acyltransferase [Thalassococcus profundi]
MRDTVIGPYARLPLAIGAGALFALGQAPFDLWPVALCGLVAGVWLLDRHMPAHSGAGIGWGFGLGYFALALSWIYEPFQIDAAATGWMAPFAVVGLAGGLALFWALAFWATARTGRLWALIPFFAGAELMRTYVLTGFPWALLPYVWAPTNAIQWVSVVGPHGLSLLTAGVAVLVVQALRRRNLGFGAGAAALVAGLIGGGALIKPAPQDLADRPVVRLIQPNAPQQEKWRRDMIPVFFNRQVDLTAAGPPADLVVWSETALPMLLANAGEALAVIRDAAGPVPVVVGVQREEAGNYYNSLVAVQPGTEVYQYYDKHHLVPFGEYMPMASVFARFNIFGLATRAEGGYAAGPGPALLDLGPLGRALPLICYEAVFPQDVGTAPERPDMLLQITNDAWFGTWSGPYQHLVQARIRAIEQGLPMLRSANTGVSAVIDGGGRVLASLPLGVAGKLDHPLPPPLPPTIYARTGDLPAFALIAMLAAAAVITRRRRPPNTD